MHKKYHWVPDYHDSRDHYVHSSKSFRLVAPNLAPVSVDLRPQCSPILNQGDLGSCTGNALVGAMEYLENCEKVGLAKDGTFVNLSRLFVYYNEREVENTIAQDAGAQISDGISVLSCHGVCVEPLWPYQVHRFAVKPPVAAYDDGKSRRISAYARVSRDHMESVCQVLASGYPIVFGFMVYDAFESEEVARTGVLEMPGQSEKCQGGHAVLMVGYDQVSRRVLVRNSWGPDWGQGGYFTMPYEYITNHNLSSDFWTISK